MDNDIWLVKARTNCTLYLNEDDNMWEDDDPRQSDNGCSQVLRKGSIVYLYDYEDQPEYQGRTFIWLTKNNKGGIIVNSDDTMYPLNMIINDWFTILEDRRKVC